MMDSADSLDEKATALATKYSIDPERVRHALLQAEECRFWRFRHHGVMKTEDALAAELGQAPAGQDCDSQLARSWADALADLQMTPIELLDPDVMKSEDGQAPAAQTCQWLLRPSLEEALALPGTDPGEWLSLFENAVPWEVRQRRLLLLDFVPYSETPTYTLDELANVLDLFVVEQDSEAPYLIETGTMIAKPGTEGWARRVLGPLYPDSPDLPSVCPRLRETVLHWRAAFVRELASDLRSAAARGDRANTRAATELWDAFRAGCHEFLGSVEHQDILRREAMALMRGSESDATAGIGAVTALALLAMHCAAEIAYGSHRKVRSALGHLVTLDSLGRPCLDPEHASPLDGYGMLFRRDAGTKGSGVEKAVSQRSRLTAGETAILKEHVAGLVSDLQGLIQGEGSGGTPDDNAMAKVRGLLKKFLLLYYHGNRAKVAEALDLVLADNTKPLGVPKSTELTWQDVTLRLEGDDLLTIRVRKGKTDQCHTWHFQGMTFTDRRCPDEVRPTDTWLMLAGILREAYYEEDDKLGPARKWDETRSAGKKRSAHRFFHMSLGQGDRADSLREIEEQHLRKIRAKIGPLVGIDHKKFPPFKNRKDRGRQHAFEILFKVEDPPKKAKSLAIWSPRDFRSEP